MSALTEAQALELYREHCQPGDRGALERYGEKAAVAAIMSALAALAALNAETNEMVALSNGRLA